jgi:outer membrane protein assembly factor BamD
MPGRIRAPLIVAAVVSAAIALSGCNLFGRGDKDEELLATPERPAGELYNEGLAYMEQGKLRNAIESFEEVDRQHPYTDYARKALIMSAFANFRRGQYDEAVTSAQRFLTLYPGNEDAAYANYIIGESYLRQVPDVTRDQAATQKALAAMTEIINTFPDSEYASDARNKLIIVRDQLAGKEMQVGRYYLERREYVAAINRFKVVVTDYQDTRHVEEALERLTESYYAMGILSEAQTAAAVLGHNFPNSPWYKDAYALLQSGGHESREDTGSWISRAFRRG